MQTIRTFFKNEIAVEYVSAKNPKSQKVIILCDGAPTVPSKRTLMEFFWKKGYAVYHMRYRGTWESRGVFLKTSPDQDVIDVVDDLSEKFKKIVLVGSSFGGPAVLLASRDQRVSKAIALSPVVSWDPKTHGPRETMAEFRHSMIHDFGSVYRGAKTNLRKLRDPFYAPLSHTNTIDGSKLLIIQAKNDDSVRWRPVQRFAKQTKSNILLMSRGGHLSSRIIMKPAIWKKVKKLLSL